MAEFKHNVPVVQADPVVSVDIKKANALPVGAHRFRLVVVDDSGNESEPAYLNVIVRDSERPTAVLDVVDKSGKAIEAVVPFGAAFILSGARSKDTEPGKVVEYRFTLVDQG